MTATALEGVRVLDFTQMMMGPWATQFLGGMGADVIKDERPGSGEWERGLRALGELLGGQLLFSWLDGFSKPVIGAVNGYALGGGFEIALCCDLLVASANARFGLPEGLLGLSPGGGGTQRLTRAAGPFVAADVLLAGRRLTAQDAYRLGLVAEVVEPERLLEVALDRAEQVARMAPLATRAMLGLVRTAMEAPLEEGLGQEQDALAGLHRTADAAEGIRAFLEKRAPRFTGE